MELAPNPRYSGGS